MRGLLLLKVPPPQEEKALERASWVGANLVILVELPRDAKRAGNTKRAACTPLDLPYTRMT